MTKRALLVGIDFYESMPELSGCVRDATALHEVLQRNDDGSPNYDCRLLVNPGGPLITRSVLQEEWHRLFATFTGDICFYFAGHGWPTAVGGAIVTHEGEVQSPGLPMNDLIKLANESSAREVLLILDCCYSGALGDVAPRSGRRAGKRRMEPQAQLREGVTILAASRQDQPSLGDQAHGIFTELLLAALTGGAADVRGNVSVASIYAYIEQVLGAWDQRPLYKSYANTLAPVRHCTPRVPDALLRKMIIYFETPDDGYRLDPSYEFSRPEATPEHVAIFKEFKAYRDTGLLHTVADEDLYFAALNSRAVVLTALGQLYWRLAHDGRI